MGSAGFRVGVKFEGLLYFIIGTGLKILYLYLSRPNRLFTMLAPNLIKFPINELLPIAGFPFDKIGPR